MEQKKILVVDDDNDLRTVLTDALTKRGFFVTEASGGTRGLELVKNNVYQLILSDVVMPDMDGIEFLRSIKKVRSDQKVILMSGNMVGQQFFKAAQILGAEYSLEKPFSIQEMLNTINMVLKSEK